MRKASSVGPAGKVCAWAVMKCPFRWWQLASKSAARCTSKLGCHSIEPVSAPPCGILWATCLGAYPAPRLACCGAWGPERLVARVRLPFRQGLGVQGCWEKAATVSRRGHRASRWTRHKNALRRPPNRSAFTQFRPVGRVTIADRGHHSSSVCPVTLRLPLQPRFKARGAGDNATRSSHQFRAART